MVARTSWLCLCGAILTLGGLLETLVAFQRPFREYPGMEYNDFPLPSDAGEKCEFAFARLMYPNSQYARGGFGRFGRSDWRQGYAWWTQDYPRADRHFLRALRRLTRVHAR